MDERLVRVKVPLYDVLPFYGERGRDYIGLPTDNIAIDLYSGYPGSPLCGGRINGLTDDPQFQSKDLSCDEIPFRTEEQRRGLRLLRQHYFKLIDIANGKLKVPVHLAYNNLFCLEELLNDENAEPLKRLVANSQRFGIKNGIIVANPKIEEWARSIAGDDLDYTLSCTTFFTKERALTREERIAAYHDAANKYDAVVITAADSAIVEQLHRIKPWAKKKMIGVVDKSCYEACNSFNHYGPISLWNIATALPEGHPKIKEFTEVARALGERSTFCSGGEVFFQVKAIFDGRGFEEVVVKLLGHDITNLKVGRKESRQEPLEHGVRYNQITDNIAYIQGARDVVLGSGPYGEFARADLNGLN